MTGGYSPWTDLASREDIAFGVARLPSGDAWWLPRRRAIVLDDRLGRVERRCALAHELAHVDHDDSCASVYAKVDLKQERWADETAAIRLIELDDLVDAMRWSANPEEVAADLEVTPHYLYVRMRIIKTHPAERAHLKRYLSEGEE